MNLPNHNPEKKDVFSMYNNKPLDLDLSVECERCKSMNTTTDMAKLPYKYLIQGYNNVKYYIYLIIYFYIIIFKKKTKDKDNKITKIEN